MSEERKRILRMLAEGKISPDEADELLDAFEKRTAANAGSAPGDERDPAAAKAKPQFLRVQILSGEEDEKVNLRVPLGLVNAGMKFSALIPEAAREKVREAMQSKGIPFDLNRMKSGSADDWAGTLSELDIDIVDGKERVRVFCE